MQDYWATVKKAGKYDWSSKGGFFQMSNQMKQNSFIKPYIIERYSCAITD